MELITYLLFVHIIQYRVAILILIADIMVIHEIYHFFRSHPRWKKARGTAIGLALAIVVPWDGFIYLSPERGWLHVFGFSTEYGLFLFGFVYVLIWWKKFRARCLKIYHAIRGIFVDELAEKAEGFTSVLFIDAVTYLLVYALDAGTTMTAETRNRALRELAQFKPLSHLKREVVATSYSRAVSDEPSLTQVGSKLMESASEAHPLVFALVAKMLKHLKANEAQMKAFDAAVANVVKAEHHGIIHGVVRFGGSLVTKIFGYKTA